MSLEETDDASPHREPHANSTPTAPLFDGGIRSSPPSLTRSIEQGNVADPQCPQSDPVMASNPRLEALLQKRTKLEAKIAALEAERAAIAMKIKLPSESSVQSQSSDETKVKSALAAAQGIVKDHIALLHKYNEIKDVGQGLMGMIADIRGVRIATVMEDFGLTNKD